jgi:hypothetical protein
MQQSKSSGDMQQGVACTHGLYLSCSQLHVKGTPASCHSLHSAIGCSPVSPNGAPLCCSCVHHCAPHRQVRVHHHHQPVVSHMHAGMVHCAAGTGLAPGPFAAQLGRDSHAGRRVPDILRQPELHGQGLPAAASCAGICHQLPTGAPAGLLTSDFCVSWESCMCACVHG